MKLNCAVSLLSLLGAVLLMGCKGDEGGTKPIGLDLEVIDFKEEMIGTLESSSDISIRPGFDKSSGLSFLSLSGQDEKADSSGKPGISLRLADSFERIAEGQIINIEIVARASTRQMGQRAAMSYSTADVGNTGWRDFIL